MQGMKRVQIERLSVRTALAIGFCVTLGLWLYTGYAFTQRITAGPCKARFPRSTIMSFKAMAYSSANRAPPASGRGHTPDEFSSPRACRS